MAASYVFFFSFALIRAPRRSSSGRTVKPSQGIRYISVVSSPLIRGMEISRCWLPHRSRITCATSSAVLIGCENVRSDVLSIFAMMKPVSIGPGDTTAILILLSLNSLAREYVNERSPALLAA